MLLVSRSLRQKRRSKDHGKAPGSRGLENKDCLKLSVKLDDIALDRDPQQGAHLQPGGAL